MRLAWVLLLEVAILVALAVGIVVNALDFPSLASLCFIGFGATLGLMAGTLGEMREERRARRQ